MTDARPPQAGLSAVKLALMAREIRGQAESVLRADPVAIVGMACRFPGGADAPEQLWDLLCRGADAVRDIPTDRWPADAWFDPDLSAVGKTITKRAAFLERIDEFDADYFGVLPREAQRMDPQQRLFLEVAIDALDDAGLSRERLRGSRTGVFVASYHNDYAQQQYADVEAIDPRTLTGTLHSVLANRLSYFLDLHGPSLSIDTACSSSLVAVHLACQSLRFGESDMAVAGGVSLIIAPELLVSMSKVGFMAPDGHCKTFDASADGFGRGEGCGIVVLKRLSDALADGDRVLAVVRGSAVNQDGHSTLLAAPHGPAQEALIREALATAQLEPGRIGFVETHGTGTALGDPIEVEAIAATLGRQPGAVPALLGSLKANIGHLEAAAGVAGLIKVVLALRHKAVPPQAHFHELNPHISLSGTRLAVPTALTPWPAGPMPRCGAVSSFGVGGTNAHVILEEAPEVPAAEAAAGDAGRPVLLPLSAHGPEALRDVARAWQPFLRTSSATLRDLCFTAAERRTHHDHRLVVLGRTREELAARLRDFLEGVDAPGALAGHRPAHAAPRIGFVFSGQGPQWFGMGRELLAEQPVFREALSQCDALLRPLSGWSLLAELARPEAESRLDQTQVAQPALFAIQVALAALWKSWGVVPDAVVGHSIGEIAALHVAGALDLPTAVRVVWHRGRIMQQATGLGRMASVGLTEAEAREFLVPFGGRVSVGAINSPRGVVLSGETAALQEALQLLGERGISQRALPVNYAFHSAQMAPFQQQLERELEGLQVAPLATALYSTVLGRLAVEGDIDAAYFGRNVREPVRFAAAVTAMTDDGCTLLLEVGPHPVLSGSIAESVADRVEPPRIAASLRRARPEFESLLQAAAAAVHATGFALQWSAIFPDAGEVVALPAYPWQHRPFWIRARPTRAGAIVGTVHPLLGSRVATAGIAARIFEGDSSAARSWLVDHRIFGALPLPAAAMIELLSAAAGSAPGAGRIEMRDLVIERPLLVPESEADVARWQTVIEPGEGGTADLALYAAAEAGDDGMLRWTRIATARAAGSGAPSDIAPHATLHRAPALPADVGALDAERAYARFAELGADFGPAFRCISAVRRADGVATAELELPAFLQSTAAAHVLHPVLIDAGLQLCSLAARGDGAGAWPAAIYLPVGLDRIVMLAGVAACRRATAVVQQQPAASAAGATLRADVYLESASGEPLAIIEGVRFTQADARAFATADPVQAPLYEVAWRVATAPAAAAPAIPQVSDPGTTWLLFADVSGYADALAAQLRIAGVEPRLVTIAERFGRGADGRWTLDPADPTHFPRLLDEVRAGQSGTSLRIAHCWNLDVATFGPCSDERAARDDLAGTASLLHLVQALARAHDACVSLTILTRGAQCVTGDEAASGLRPRAAGAWGLRGVIAAEHPELRCRIVDLDPAAPIDAAVAVALRAELFADTGEQIALRHGQRWAPRLQPLARTADSTSRPARNDADAPMRQLVLARAGTLDGVEFVPTTRTEPGPDELRVAVIAAGLNFRDVLLTLGMYPGADVPLGAECAGVVTAVGSRISGIAPGTRVFGYARASFATEVVGPAAFFAPVPEGMGFEAAAALPVAFLTAHRGLHGLAGLRRGERVLVHAAAGGVGMAAVQLAQRCGAVVYATAGSPAKREMLASLGVAGVMDSRSLAFADELLAATGGAGVDVVLNSLAGEFIPASLRVLAPGGRFLELGKRDVWSLADVARVRPDVRYHLYDLGSEAEADHSLLWPMFDDLLAAFRAGELRPLPVQVFGVDAVEEAMRHMAQARHVGKLVIRFAADPAPLPAAAATVHAQSTYLVTGGLGALGLETARWLVRRGARHLVLVGRHPPSGPAAAVVQELRAAGTSVHVGSADAGDRDALRTVLDDIGRRGPPLRGVVHAAGALRDGVLLHQEWRGAREALQGKAHGAWLLDELTRALPLDFFVLYSAAGSLLGAAGQGVYPAANAELDALALARRRAGLPALSVEWGLWSSGMGAASAGQGGASWEARGLRPIDPDLGFGGLQRLLDLRVACAAVLPIDWGRFLRERPAAKHDDFFAGVRHEPRDALARPAARTAGSADSSLVQSLLALPSGQRRGALLACIAERALAVLGLDPSTRIDPRVALKDIGLDSLMAVELRNALNRVAPQPLPATLLFDYPTLDALAAQLASAWGLEAAPDAAGTAASAGEFRARQEIAQMTDDEAEAALLAELGQGVQEGPR